MPRGEPTRAITVRIPEEMAQSVEERATRAGRTLREEIAAVLSGTFRYPGRLYTFAESEERKKMVRQIAELQGQRDSLITQLDTLSGQSKTMRVESAQGASKTIGEVARATYADR